MRHAFPLLILVHGVFFLPFDSQAQWQPGGVALSTAANDQWSPVIFPDGAGGAIVA